MNRDRQTNLNLWRHVLVAGVMMMVAGGLVGRAIDLQLLSHDFLQRQGDARYLRTVEVLAHRGMIADRYGEPLAMSTPVASVWADPSKLLPAPETWDALAERLGMTRQALAQRLRDHQHKEFVYLRRHLNPRQAREVLALNAPGVAQQREYQRYYPSGEVSAHVLGFTNIDDVGQEGLELAFDERLRGVAGRKRVIQDRLGRVVETVAQVREPRAGDDVTLSLDRRLQYLAYRELKAAVQRHQAEAGSVVMLDARTGEILAMVNQPAANPNDRDTLQASRFRNRAVTDVFEPGSTVKPFTVAAALESGQYSPDTQIDTGPGYFRLGGYTIHDLRNYGTIDVSTVIQKSSNVGVSKIALSLNPQQLLGMFAEAGLGSATGSRFPGEVDGSLPAGGRWYPVERATFGFGYGLAVTPLQLAQAYLALANHGQLKPVTFLRRDEAPRGRRIMAARNARQVITMLEAATGNAGTGARAQVDGYSVAGKTGTVRKSASGGYAEDRYVALFAGVAPATDPRLVMVVTVDEPQGEAHYGGEVAAPVFGEVMAGALRLLNVPLDHVPSLPGTMASDGQTNVARVLGREGEPL